MDVPAYLLCSYLCPADRTIPFTFTLLISPHPATASLAPFSVLSFIPSGGISISLLPFSPLAFRMLVYWLGWWNWLYTTKSAGGFPHIRVSVGGQRCKGLQNGFPVHQIYVIIVF